MVRLYLDEHLGDLLTPLRASGHDVTFGGDQGRSGKTDAWHFREALDDSRVMVTLDKGDFEYLHKLWTTLRTFRVVDDQHAGILTAAGEPGFSHSDWVQQLRDKLRESALEGRLLKWVQSTGRWHEAQWRPEEE
jgi:hypothetical protein